MELAEGSSMLYFSLVAQIAVLNVDADVTGHLWPPIIAVIIQTPQKPWNTPRTSIM
jgi:hypothetical protein